MRVLGIIPARYASTRFPAKPLVDIKGKSMIQRVYEQAKQAESLAKVVVATDDKRIFDHVKSFSGEVVMTSLKHKSGTDRCAEVVAMLNLEAITESFDTDNPIVFYGFNPKKERVTFDAVVNIQGDEPFIDPLQIEKVVEILRGGVFKIATLVKKMDDLEAILNPNIVKVVFDSSHKAIYFSRNPIPFLRDTPQYDWAKSGEFHKHLGLYAYKTNILKEIADLEMSRLEKLESLEQLRWLENNYDIGVALTDIETIGIDTPEDLEKVLNYKI